jgi:hypothetical protein
MVWSETNRIVNHINSKKIQGCNAYDIRWLQKYEKPYLINPEMEKSPERHFIFKSDGVLKGRTNEGKENIIICDLDSKDLRRERLELMEEYVIEIKDALDEFAFSNEEADLRGSLKTTFRRLKRMTHPDKKHSLFHLFMFRYFEYFICSKLPIALRNKTSKYFQDFNS